MLTIFSANTLLSMQNPPEGPNPNQLPRFSALFKIPDYLQDFQLTLSELTALKDNCEQLYQTSYEDIIPTPCCNNHYLTTGAFLNSYGKFSLKNDPKFYGIYTPLCMSQVPLLLRRFRPIRLLSENPEFAHQLARIIEESKNKECLPVKEYRAPTCSSSKCLFYYINPLMTATAFGHYKAVKHLSTLIDVNEQNRYGRTALFDGFCGLSLELLLINKYLAHNNQYLNLLIKNTFKDFTKTFVHLLKRKNAQQIPINSEKITPFMIASLGGFSTLAGLLLYHGADATAVDHADNTAVTYANPDFEKHIKNQFKALKEITLKNNAHDFLPFAEFEKISPLITNYQNFKKVIEEPLQNTYLNELPSELINEIEKFVLEVPNY